jgi:hypothetical protein
MTRAVDTIGDGSRSLLSRKIARLTRLLYPAPRAGEDFLSPCQNFVQRIGEVRGGLGKLLPDLLDEFLVALFDLLAEEGFERSLT